MMKAKWTAIVSMLVLAHWSSAEAASNRCTDKWKNEYVIYPGSNCTKFVQWAKAAPSGRVLACPARMRFNVQNCHCDIMSNVKCPASKPPIDCTDLSKYGITFSGIYNFTVGTCEMAAYCDMDGPDSGWLLIQKREISIQKPLDFYEGMKEYTQGFGQLGFEFWWGLDNLYQLTNPKKNGRRYDVKVDLKDFTGHAGYGIFSDFSVGGANDGYRLSVGKMCNGTIGDSFVGARNKTFCTRDHDCNKMAAKHHGGWWFSKDAEANLNGNGQRKGPYHARYADGVFWKSFKGVWYSLEATRMSLRPSAETPTTSSTTSTTKSTTSTTKSTTSTTKSTTSTTKSTTASTTTKTTTKTTTPTTIHKSSTTTRRPDGKSCTKRDTSGDTNIYYIYPGTGCQKFAEYSYKERYGRVLECPPGTIFNVKNCQCDHPESTACPNSDAPLDCSDLMTYGLKVDGIYEFTVGHFVLTAACLQTKMGGGWLIIQNREMTHIQPPPLNFSKFAWDDYEKGFGQVGYEFWWGLAKMNLLTSLNRYDLRLILHDYDSKTTYAHYTGFSVGSARTGYAVRVGKFMDGEAGDSLSSSQGIRFYTPDRDNAKGDAKKHHGGWWYNKDKITANLNGNSARRGRYNATTADGVFWKSWHGEWYSLASTTLMIKPSLR